MKKIRRYVLFAILPNFDTSIFHGKGYLGEILKFMLKPKVSRITKTILKKKAKKKRIIIKL